MYSFDGINPDRSLLGPRFRPGRQFALTWGIPDPFGGMTGALLHRSRAFVRLGGRPVDVLTLDDRLDYPEREQALRRSGDLIDGMRLFNIWDWFREHDLPAHRSASRYTHAPIEQGPGVRERRRGDAVLLRELRADDGTVLQTDRFRMDGTLLSTDRRGAGTGERSVVLYDASGRAIRGWGSVWGIYRYWLDQLIGSQESYLIVDSKTAARFVHTYRRRNVVTMHVVHGSHRAADGRSPRASRRTVLENLSDYDGVVLLTEGQRADLLKDAGPQDNVVVIPNGFDAAGAPPEVRPRARGAGVMLASLTRRKRVSHAVKAVARAARSAEVELDVYGEGERRPLLEKTIGSFDVAEIVRLRGHDAAARSAFHSADFTVLTSTSEGLPLALVEAMAAGCIPIAYDIPYGPADLIRTGRNGFLVPDGDIDALAERIVELQRLPEGTVAAMRRQAIATAQRFSDRAVTAAWAREMARAFERKHARNDRDDALALRLRSKAGRLKRRLMRRLGMYR